MNTQQHNIRKFILELQLPAGHHAYTLQRRCCEIVKEKLVKGLDNLLNTYFEGPGIMRISRIYLDLGNMTPDDIENGFAEKCLYQLSEKFKTISLQKEKDESFLKSIDEKQYVIDQFLYFLSSGQLPSLAGFPLVDEWKKEVLNAIKGKHTYFTGQFLSALAQHTYIIKRLFFQFDKNFIEELLYACEQEVKKQVMDIILQDPLIIEKYLIQFCDTVVEQIFYAYDPALKDKISELLFLLQNKGLKKSSLQNRERILIFLFEMLNNKSAEKLIASIEDIKEWIADPAEESEFLMPQLKDGIPQIQKEKNSFETEKIKSKVDQEEVIEKSVLIKNAGIIIFHPFLTGLFERTGLMHNNNFIDDEAKGRAVHLLQYLAGGQEQLPEYLMPLNKILCGIPGETHIDRFIVLTQAEKNEADELVQAVIGHWSILKNTSNQALQETFLQRKGKLSFIEEDRFWKLQVEKNALDVLLDKLSWGFSYIQLPWMK